MEITNIKMTKSLKYQQTTKTMYRIFNIVIFIKSTIELPNCPLVTTMATKSNGHNWNAQMQYTTNNKTSFSQNDMQNVMILTKWRIKNLSSYRYNGTFVSYSSDYSDYIITHTLMRKMYDLSTRTVRDVVNYVIMSNLSSAHCTIT